MKALSFAPAERKLLSDSAKPFSVVVAFDDFTARQKAIQVYSRLIKQSGNDFEIECNMWRFDELGPASRGPEAARVAAGSDMIVFASSNETLPDTIKLWIEMWLAERRDRETALVAVIGMADPHGGLSTAA